MPSFSDQIAAASERAQRLMMAVFQTALGRVVDDAQTPTAQGGRMRVDTGFLRGSLAASYDGLPSGPGRGDSGEYDAQPIILAIAQLPPGGTIWLGWTASYARYREAKDGFLRLAAQRWDEQVERAASEARSRAR